MDLEDEIPVGILHVLEADIPEDAGIIDQHIDATEVLDGRVDNLVAEFDRVVVGYGLAASSTDLVDDDISGLCGKGVRSARGLGGRSSTRKN